MRIQLSGVRKAFGARVLIDAVNWHVNSGDRVGLCGPNGSGKTTLLRMMVGLDEPDKGAITRSTGLTVGYLPQEGLNHSGNSLFTEACEGFGDLLSIQREMHDLESRLGDPGIPETEHNQMLDRYSNIQQTFHDQGGYDIEAKVAVVLRGLGFRTEQFDNSCETFSGGWQMRIALAKLLLGSPHLLLLDEPTNHLDLEARNWLEDYLVAYPHAVVLVSHDRYFLDTVVTKVVEIGLRKLTTYQGGYSAYLVEREVRLQHLREQKRGQDEEVARIKAFINRFRYQATKAAQVQSRVKMLEKIKPIEVPPERKRVHFTFPSCTRSARAVIELKEIKKTYGELTVFDRTNVLIERGDRVALVGLNGSGKSTLMRILAGAEAPDTGDRIEGSNVVAQYFAQDEATRLNERLTVHDTLAANSLVQMVPAIRNILGGFLFSGDDIYKPVAVLSGGERTRLAVARMLLRPSNTLLLDEPTNHLDIDSTNVLLDALADYGGTLIFVSHDRYFVDRLASKILEIGNGEAVLYPGLYEEFRLSKLERSENPTSVHQSAIAQVGSKPDSAEAHRKKQAEIRRYERQRKASKAKIVELEQRINKQELTIQELEVKMAQPDFYDDKASAQEKISQHQHLMWEVGDLMNQWEALQEESDKTRDT